MSLSLSQAFLIKCHSYCMNHTENDKCLFTLLNKNFAKMSSIKITFTLFKLRYFESYLGIIHFNLFELKKTKKTKNLILNKGRSWYFKMRKVYLYAVKITLFCYTHRNIFSCKNIKSVLINQRCQRSFRWVKKRKMSMNMDYTMKKRWICIRSYE